MAYFIIIISILFIKIGYGEEELPNGMKIKGNFKDGLLEGQGTLTFKDGTVYKYLFYINKLIY